MNKKASLSCGLKIGEKMVKVKEAIGEGLLRGIRSNGGRRYKHTWDEKELEAHIVILLSRIFPRHTCRKDHRKRFSLNEALCYHYGLDKDIDDIEDPDANYDGFDGITVWDEIKTQHGVNMSNITAPINSTARIDLRTIKNPIENPGMPSGFSVNRPSFVLKNAMFKKGKK